MMQMYNPQQPMPLSVTTENSDEKVLDNYEQAFMKYLVHLYTQMSGEKIDLNSLKGSFDMLDRIKSMRDQDYLKTLTLPEKTRGAKIPSPIPTPTSSFQLKQSFTVTTNALGNAAVMVNPYFLEDNTSGTVESTVYVNNSATLSGNSPDDNFTSINVGQAIPPVYSQYRVVSASIVARYTGRLDIVQGNIGGAIIYDVGIQPKPAGQISNIAAKYGDFNLAKDAYYQQEHMALEGIRELYFPLDNSYEEYTPFGAARPGFNYFIYLQNLPPSTTSVRFDMYVNFECLPNNEFLNYIPVSKGCGVISPDQKPAAIRAVTTRPIVTAATADETPKKSGDFFGNLIGKVGSFLPKIGDIAKNVIPVVGDLLGGFF